MQNREFEKSVQQKMEELKLVPSDALWGKVEAELPAEKKPRRWALFIWLAAAILVSGILLNHHFSNGNKKETATAIDRVTPVVNTAADMDTAKNNGPAATSGSLNNNNAVTTADVKLTDETAVATGENIKLKNSKTPKVNTGSETVVYNSVQQPVEKNKHKKILSNAAVKVKIKAPQPVNGNNSEMINEFNENEIVSAIGSKAEKISVNEKQAAKNTGAQPVADSLQKKDTAAVNTVAANSTKEKSVKKAKWLYGVYLTAGNAAVKNGVFSKQPFYAGSLNAAAFNQQPGIGAGGTGNSSLPQAPASSTAFAFGFTAEKNIASRWKFVTGINYMYQSNTMRVGKKVDSAVAVNFDANKSIHASNYYTTGSAEKYRNNFHLLEVPMLLQYKPLQKLPVYLEGGFTASGLVHSNALVYNAVAAAYVTDAAVFNRLLLSANAGAGITLLQKTKYPVSIGGQFRQGIISVIKPAFGRQYFVNSLLYARLTFKK